MEEVSWDGKIPSLLLLLRSHHHSALGQAISVPHTHEHNCQGAHTHKQKQTQTQTWDQFAGASAAHLFSNEYLTSIFDAGIAVDAEEAGAKQCESCCGRGILPRCFLLLPKGCKFPRCCVLHAREYRVIVPSTLVIGELAVRLRLDVFRCVPRHLLSQPHTPLTASGRVSTFQI